MDISHSSYKNLDNRTARAHWAHLEAGSFLATQAWSWEAQEGIPEGDACVVCVHSLTNNRDPFVFIRMGDTIRTVQARGVTPALESLGYSVNVL